MANLQDYVRWRGDVTLDERPFNVVDNLVLCALGYLDLRGVVPAVDDGGSVTLVEAATRRDALRAGSVGGEDPRLTAVDPTLLGDLAASARFGDARLSHFVDVVDEGEGMQFSAVTVTLGDGTRFIAFRGTDNTILGWREDFTMSFRPVPAQRFAARYLADRVADADGPVLVGGHSKGGHLAVYAAGVLDPGAQHLLARVYNNDGPGLAVEVGAGPGTDHLDDKVVTTVPEFAVIGMLFPGTQGTRRVVASSARGLLQHDLMTWQVVGADIVELPGLSARATLINGALGSWIEQAPTEDRQAFTDAFFGALSAGGARLISDVRSSEYGSVESVLLALHQARHQTRRTTRSAVRSFARAACAVDYRAALRRSTSVRALALVALGTLLSNAPAIGPQVLAAFTLFTVLVVLTVRVARLLARHRERFRITWPKVVLGAALVAAALLTLSQVQVLTLPANALIGIAFLLGGWSCARAGLRMRHARPRRRARSVLLLAGAATATGLGAVALTTATHVLPFFVQVAGFACLAWGIGELFLLLKDQIAREHVRVTASRLWSAPTTPS